MVRTRRWKSFQNEQLTKRFLLGSSLRGRRGLDAPMPAQDSRTNSSPIISPDSSEAQADEENPVRSTRRVRRTPVTMDNSSDDLDIITPLRRRQRKSRETASAISSPEPFCKPTPSRGPTARTFLAGGKCLSQISLSILLLLSPENFPKRKPLTFALP